MLKVVFCADGQAVSDFKALDFVDNITATYCRNYGRPMEIRFSTECVLDAFVLRVMEEKIPADRIKFYYQGPDMESEVEMEFHEIRGLRVPDEINEIGVRCNMTRNIFNLGFEKLKAKSVKGTRKEN